MRVNFPLLLVLLSLSFPSFGADFQKGLSAARSGDFATAVKEFTPLAEQGNATAQFNLGVMYATGRGVPQNYKVAEQWYILAATQGDVEAQYNLGVMYRNGFGIPQNDQAAVEWFRLAAEQGNVPSQFNLGHLYDRGEGVLQDNIYAHMWWNIAASLGNDPASKNREIIAKRMTPTDISAAQKLARECVAKDYKGC